MYIQHGRAALLVHVSATRLHTYATTRRPTRPGNVSTAQKHNAAVCYRGSGIVIRARPPSVATLRFTSIYIYIYISCSNKKEPPTAVSSAVNCLFVILNPYTIYAGCQVTLHRSNWQKIRTIVLSIKHFFISFTVRARDKDSSLRVLCANTRDFEHPHGKTARPAAGMTADDYTSDD